MDINNNKDIFYLLHNYCNCNYDYSPNEISLFKRSIFKQTSIIKLTLNCIQNF